eukprot:scaffold82467_cov54-Attheya_sp.AAC.7
MSRNTWQPTQPSIIGVDDTSSNVPGARITPGGGYAFSPDPNPQAGNGALLAPSRVNPTFHLRVVPLGAGSGERGAGRDPKVVVLSIFFQ